MPGAIGTKINLDELQGTPTAFVPYHRGRTKRDALDLSFVAWDGEGITPPDEKRQNYVLFSNSLGYSVKGYKLSTQQCLEMMITTQKENPQSIHCGFAFSYDAEMILVDLSLKHLQRLRAEGSVLWRQYRIEFRRSKWFMVTDRTQGITCKIWDVWGFFQSSFVAAIKSNIGDIPELPMIEAGKAGRAQFTYPELESGYIEEYCNLELDLLVRMMTTLRERLYAAGYRIRYWHGPAAIATYAFRSHKLDKVMSKDAPEQVVTASRYAYAGGRFELFQLGHHQGDIYSYDIRSAYPSAIRLLPNMATGTWRKVENPTEIARFGVYRISFKHGALMTTMPMPFFYRDAHSAIHFPNVMEGWVWSPEAKIAKSVGATIHEAWVYEDDGSYPLDWVNDVYNTRAQWKREGNPSQIALKLLLNSMYGKFAQRIGWERTGKAPTWHQFEWAGFVTSHARSQMYKAMLQAHQQGSLLGVETDGIFSTKPLNLDIGPNLGQWEAEQYDGMIYLQSGVYFKRTGDEWTAKYRGFDKGCLSVDQVLTVLNEWKPWEDESRGVITGVTTRFSSMGHYLRTKEPEEQRNTWSTEPRRLTLGEDGKRIHRPSACRACKERVSPAEGTHDLTIHHPIGGLSYPRILPWLGVTEQVANHWDLIERDSHDHG